MCCRAAFVKTINKKTIDKAEKKIVFPRMGPKFENFRSVYIAKRPNEVLNKGWVTVLGVICPFLYESFRLNRVNRKKICVIVGLLTSIFGFTLYASGALSI